MSAVTAMGWANIADDLRRQIESGDLAAGEKLPAETTLAREYDVNRTTVRSALRRLTSEGLVVSQKGRGSFVRQYAPLRWSWSGFESQDKHARGYDGVDAWEASVRDQDRTPELALTVEIVRPPAPVASRLGLGEGEIAVARRRVRLIDGVPFLLQDSYMPESLVRGTDLMLPHDVSAPGGVLNSLGHVQTRYVDEITCRMPTKVETERLQLPSGTAVAEHMRTGYDADDCPLRCMVSVLPGDRHVMVYELDAS